MMVARLYKAALFTLLILSLTPLARADAPRLQKLQAVLNHFNVPAEFDFAVGLKRWDGTQTRQGFETILKYMDPRGELKRYLSWDDAKLTVFQDRDAKQVVDYTLSFKTSGTPDDPLHWVATIRRAARNNPSAQPLKELRIALDPGHMGGRIWDLKTGKFVHLPAGGYVSEGVIAFDVCMLLKRELEKLGATVMITRHGLTPVSELDPATFELTPLALDELLSDTDAPWFDSLLKSAPLGQALLANADHNAHIRGLFSKGQRDNFFISRADLRARGDKINAFKPDLSLIIHFDAAKLTEVQNGGNAVRGYVEGDFMAGEAPSHEIRAQAVQALVDGHRWIESNVFTAAVVKGISTATHVPILNSSEDYDGERVTKGVYARNLALTRLVNHGITTYIEVLHYDYAPEFKRLIKLDRHTEIEGVKLDYSSRLDDVVVGIKQGILDYVHSMDSRTDDNQLP